MALALQLAHRVIMLTQTAFASLAWQTALPALMLRAVLLAT